MRKPSFFVNVVVAAALALAAGAVLALLGASDASLRLIVAGVAGAYVLWLLSKSEERIGRVTTVALWLALAALLWLGVPDAGTYLALHVGLIWLVRSLFFHPGVLIALLDLGLVMLGVGGALWAASTTGSFTAAVWTFFLVQALFAWLPEHIGGRASASGEPLAGEGVDRFALAERAADSALKRIAGQRS